MSDNVINKNGIDILNVPFEVYDRDVEVFGGTAGSAMRWYEFTEDDIEDIEEGIAECEERIANLDKRLAATPDDENTLRSKSRMEARLAIGKKILAEVKENEHCEFIAYI